MKNQLFKKFILFILFVLTIFPSCKKDPKPEPVAPSVNLAIDSLVATKTNIIVWEEIYIKAYTRGQNIKFQWSADHGSMWGTTRDSIKYWGCPSCVGINTVQCKVTNDYGTITDTIQITVN